MKRILIALALLGLGLAFAETPDSGPGEVWTSGDGPQSVSESIQVSIPVRVALHITETAWDLDLDQVPPADQLGEGCYLIPKNFGDYNDDGTVDAKDAFDAYMDGELRPAHNYPAIYDYDGDGKIADDEKGTLFCVNKKIVQKFCNNWSTGTGDGCEFDLKVNITSPYPWDPETHSFGRMFFHDEAELPDDGTVENYVPFVELTAGSNLEGQAIEIIRMRGARFPGWLDDYITEGFWFDGTELPGTYVFTVTFRIDPI